MADATQQLDPVTLEIMEHRLWQITSEMGTTLRRVSGSPVTLDAKDYATGLMGADGSLLMVNCGVLFHAVTLPYAVKHILAKYADNPGIYPGDVFLVNDPYICSVHAPDMYLLAPIHDGADLVAWAGSMTHLVDIGGIDPGGLSPRATDAWQEGLRLPGLKLVERGVLRQDLWDMILNLVRDPGMVGLDIRAQIACAHVAATRIPELIAEHGRAAYHALTEAVVDSAAVRMRARLGELPDGVWRTRVYYDEDGHTERVYEIDIEMTKSGERLTFDLTGTSEQAPSFINCGVRGATAGVFGAVAPMIGYDLPWSQGVIDSIEVIAPEGSFVNPLPPAPTSLGTIAAADAVMSGTQEVIAKMLMASDVFREDFTAMWGSIVGCPVVSGLNQQNEYRVQLLMQCDGTGAGARSYADGVDTGGSMYIPEISIPNVETYEVDLPLLFLYVRQRADSGGPGKWRGGNGLEMALTLHDSPTGEVLLPFVGRGTRAPIISGMSGGYPSANWLYAIKRGTNIATALAAGRVPASVDELEGKQELLPANGVTVIHNGDVFQFAVHGGGGFGDPLDRDPERVRRDVANHCVSAGVARDIYGVVLTADGRVDDDATRERRQQARLSNQAPTPGGRVVPGTAPQLARLTEYVVVKELDGSAVQCCRCCGHLFGPAGGNYKAGARIEEAPPASVGPYHHAVDGFVLRRFLCPGCGVQLDVEVAHGDAPVIDDHTPLPLTRS